MAAGLERHNTSAFSSPGPLVFSKKKKESSRLFVDYRALHQLTVNDRFPITMFDELIDELHG